LAPGWPPGWKQTNTGRWRRGGRGPALESWRAGPAIPPGYTGLAGLDGGRRPRRTSSGPVRPRSGRKLCAGRRFRACRPARGARPAHGFHSHQPGLGAGPPTPAHHGTGRSNPKKTHWRGPPTSIACPRSALRGAGNRGEPKPEDRTSRAQTTKADFPSPGRPSPPGNRGGHRRDPSSKDRIGKRFSERGVIAIHPSRDP